LSEPGPSISKPSPLEHTILVVDDQVEVLKALKRELSYWLLEKNVGFLSASSAAEALDILAQAHDSVSLVISDLRMPDMSGSDLLLRVHELYPDLILMLLTAYHDVPEIRKAVSATLHSLILKPWDTHALIAEIEKALAAYRLQRDSHRRMREIQEQLRMAGHFQKVLLRTQVPETDRVRVDVTYRPASHIQIGGDYYDLIELGKEKFMLLVGDVSGHGVKPALVTAMLKILISEIIRGSGPSLGPSRLLTLLNNRVCREFASAPEVVVTLAVVLIDLPGMKFAVSNAGHPPVYLLRGEQCIPYPVEGTAMGFKEDLDYREEQNDLAPGDILVLFTDGFVDRGPGRKRMNEVPLRNLLLHARRDAAFNRDVLLLAGIEEAADGNTDDVTLVSIHIKP
jgi:sigma-B regulation protein RsbU (phosphoserine phosphatase)